MFPLRNWAIPSSVLIGKREMAHHAPLLFQPHELPILRRYGWARPARSRSCTRGGGWICLRFDENGTRPTRLARLGRPGDRREPRAPVRFAVPGCAFIGDG